MKRELRTHAIHPGTNYMRTRCGSDSWTRKSPKTFDPALVTCLTCRRLMKKRAK